MNHLQAQTGELRITLAITRANGQVDNVELVGRTTPDELKQLQLELGKEAEDGPNPLDRGT
jgi:hypothetical protein